MSGVPRRVEHGQGDLLEGAQEALSRGSGGGPRGLASVEAPQRALGRNQTAVRGLGETAPARIVVRRLHRVFPAPSSFTGGAQLQGHLHPESLLILASGCPTCW